jgi:hypothetical protein
VKAGLPNKVSVGEGIGKRYLDSIGLVSSHYRV